MTRARAAAVALLLLPLPLLPAPSPARAADPPGSVEVAVVGLADSFTDIQRFEPPVGPRTSVNRAAGTYVTSSLETSRDGSRIVTSIDEGDNEGVTVYDISGTQVYRESNLGYGLYRRAALSPAGNLVTYAARIGLDAFCCRPEGPAVQRVIDLRTGGVRDFPLTEVAGAPEFLTDDLLLVEEPVVAAAISRTRFRLISVSGARLPALTGLADPAEGDLSELTVDPSGTRLAWVRTAGAERRLEVAPLSITATLVTVGPPVVVATGPVFSPAFTRDGTRLAHVANGDQFGGDLVSVPVAGGPALPYAPATPERERFLAIGARQPAGVAPPPPAVGPARLQGTAAAIPLRLGAGDRTTSVLRVRLTAAGEEPVTRTQPVTAGAFRATDLTLGRDYTLTAEPVDRSGNVGPATVLRFVATAPPALSAPDPTSSGSATTAFPLSLAPAGNPADTRYSVERQVQGNSTWTRLLTRGAGTSLLTTGSPGQTYVYRAQAVDRFGNDTAVTAPSDRVAVPFDQSRATYAGRGIATAARQGAYGGTTTFLFGTGATATWRSAGDRLLVIGERCPTCGAFDVMVDGVRAARVDSFAPTRSVRQVLWTSPIPMTNRVRVVTVRTLGTPGRPGIVLDALAARRFGPPPGASLLSAQQLRNGQLLASRNGLWSAGLINGAFVVRSGSKTANYIAGGGSDRLVMRRDGNLVVLDKNGRVGFATRTAGNGSSTLILNDNGTLVVYRDVDGRPLWSQRRGRLY